MSASTPDMGLTKPISGVDQAHQSIQSNRLLRHPNFILRVGGEPVYVLQSLNSHHAASLANQLMPLQVAKIEAVAQACAAIEAVVPTVANPAEKRSLIQLKRNLFNGRAVSADTVAALNPVLGPHASSKLIEALASIDRHRVAEGSVSVAFDADVAAGSDALRRAGLRTNLRTALISSSAPLVQAIAKLEDGEALRRKDWVNLHLALAGFVTRATLKTSPRSSFTFVALGTWDENGTASPSFSIDQPIISRDVRVRHSVLERLLLPLAHDTDKLLMDAPAAVNGTIRIERDAAEWQRIAYSETPEMETFGIVSTTNRLQLRPALFDALSALASAHPRTLQECRELLRSRLGGVDYLQSDQLLRKLLKLDLIVLNDQLPSQQDKLDWASSLARWARPEIAATVAMGVQQIAHACQQMVTDGSQTEPLRAMERGIDTIAERLGSDLRSDSLRPVFYEDCQITEPSISMREEGLALLWNDLTSLLSLLPLLRGYGWAGAWLTSRFVKLYGVGGRCYEPLAFLGGTAEAIAAANGGSQSLPPWQTGTVPDDPDAYEQNIVSARFAEAIAEHNHGMTDWTVPSSLVARFHSMLPPSYRRRARSHCINGQLASSDGGMRFILNSVYPGNGRMTSRFLQSGDAAAAYIRTIASGEPVSIPGVFGFNANLHPHLSARELVIPPYPAEYSMTGKVQLAQCSLRHNQGLNRVVLEGPEGELLAPFYFGILNSWALPPIHRTLDWLNGAADLPFAVPDAIISRERPAEPPTIWLRPRIVMGNIILGRRSWSVSREALPDPSLEDLAFFLALRETWAALNLPKIVFFQASNFWRTVGAATTRPSKTRKPMYLDIDNVWLVRTFARALRSMAGHLVVTECLPEPGDTPVRVDSYAHSAELTVEVGLREADV